MSDGVTNNTAATIEDVIVQHEQIKEEIEHLRSSVKTAGDDAERANERITALEKRMDEISLQLRDVQKDVNTVKVDVREFGPRQELFMQNTWKLIFNLVMLVGALFVIVAGLVGIKLLMPTLGVGG